MLPQRFSPSAGWQDGKPQLGGIVEVFFVGELAVVVVAKVNVVIVDEVGSAAASSSSAKAAGIIAATTEIHTSTDTIFILRNGRGPLF